MKKICPNCGVENEENAKFCMNCAAKLSEEITENTTKNENKFYRKLIPIIIIVMVFIAILSIILINKYKEKEKAAGRTKGQTLPFSNVCLIVQDEPLCVKGCF
mgnify:CR=1 FL=1